jgi:hypothetical protein
VQQDTVAFLEFDANQIRHIDDELCLVIEDFGIEAQILRRDEQCSLVGKSMRLKCTLILC